MSIVIAGPDYVKNTLQRSISEIDLNSFKSTSSNQMQLIDSMKHPTLKIDHETISTKSRSKRSISLEEPKEAIYSEKNKPENGQLVYYDLESDGLELDFFCSNGENDFFNTTKLFEENNSDSEESVLEFNLSENKRNFGFFEKTLPTHYECQICMDSCYVNLRPCCRFKSCNNCINLYIQTKIKESCGNLSIECLNNECKKLIQKDEICERMFTFDKNTHDLYLKILIDANKNSDRKTCPQCSFILDVKSIQNKSVNESKLVTKCKCTKCELVWCFKCHAPWHEGISCDKFLKGDNMLKYWAKEIHYGQQNAQMCPKCKIYIQRIKGCDHIICSNCHGYEFYK